MSTFLKFISIVSGFLLAAVVIFLAAFPHVPTLRYVNPGVTTMMLERAWPLQWTWVDLGRIAPSLRRAVVEAEDGNFYRHDGIDLKEMKASVRKNWKKKRYARGFSTITMQLARNLYLPREKTLTRKAAEILITLELEQWLSKDRILEIYLNVVEWGTGIYGAEAASQHYFKKTAQKLTADEAAFLAAILPNPRKWGRWPPGPYVARRKKTILSRIGFSSLKPVNHPPVQLPTAPEGEEEMLEDGT